MAAGQFNMVHPTHLVSRKFSGDERSRMAPGMSKDRISFSAWLFCAIGVLTIIHAFFPIRTLVLIAAALIVLFLALQFRYIPRTQQIAGLGLIALGLTGAAISGEWQSTLIDGIARSRIFLLLFLAVSWLQTPVGSSPALQASRATLLSQPPGRRFLYLSFGVHCIGSVLNLAGLGLLSTVVEKQPDATLRRRLTLALMQGFTAASCWSPFYIGMIVVLVALPSLEWGQLAPAGIPMAAMIILTGWLYDRLINRRRRSGRAEGAVVPLSRSNLARTAAILILLIALVMAVVEITETSIPVTLGLVGPPFALIWYGIIKGGRGDLATPLLDMAHGAMLRLPSLRNESMVFVAANIFGVGLSTVIPSESLGELVQGLVPSADLRIALLVYFFLFCGILGLHPVIIVIALTAILPPEALGLSPWIVGVLYLGAWGTTTMVSPFSGTTLFMSRATGVAPHIIGWQWALGPALVAGTAIALFVIALQEFYG